MAWLEVHGWNAQVLRIDHESQRRIMGSVSAPLLCSTTRPMHFKQHTRTSSEASSTIAANAITPAQSYYQSNRKLFVYNLCVFSSQPDISMPVSGGLFYTLCEKPRGINIKAHTTKIIWMVRSQHWTFCMRLFLCS